MYATTITKTGQITLNKSARDFMRIKPGDKVLVCFKNGGLFVNRMESDEEFFAALDARNSEKTKEAIRNNAGKSIDEMRAEWAKSPAGQKYFKEKYDE